MNEFVVDGHWCMKFVSLFTISDGISSAGGENESIGMEMGM